LYAADDDDDDDDDEEEEGEENSLSLSLQECRKARTTAADISQISFPLHFLTKNKLITKHRSNTTYRRIFSFLYLLVLSWSIYIHYTDHMYMRETIIIHVM
jgi:hypothetical protein